MAFMSERKKFCNRKKAFYKKGLSVEREGDNLLWQTCLKNLLGYLLCTRMYGI